jgi:hypothetical protein
MLEEKGEGIVTRTVTMVASALLSNKIWLGCLRRYRAKKILVNRKKVRAYRHYFR